MDSPTKTLRLKIVMDDDLDTDIFIAQLENRRDVHRVVDLGHKDFLRSIGERLWKLEGKEDWELADIRRDIEDYIDIDLRHVQKSWDDKKKSAESIYRMGDQTLVI